MVIIGNMFVA